MEIGSCITLNCGIPIPQLGYGTALISEDPAVTADRILTAIDAGYRLLDTAAVYGNEEAVGEALLRCGLRREELFVTTKLWTTDMRQGREYQAFEESLSRLGLDYVDLYLIHWPVRGRYPESWKVLERIYKEGRARSIGVSNFNPHHIDDILGGCEIPPAVNQYQCHPQMSCRPLRDYCQKHRIAFQACQPLGQGLYVTDPVLQTIGEAYGKTAAQVVLRWNLQRGMCTVPKSASPARIRENAALFDFALNQEDLGRIDGMNMDKSVVDADPETFDF